MDELVTLRLAALADPTRRAIVARLAQGEATVAELQKPFRISQPAISKHLKVLEVAGLIETSQAAQFRPRHLRMQALRETAAWFERIGSLWQDSFSRLDALLREPESPAEEPSDMTDSAPQTAELSITRHFAADRQRVWDAWTRAELLARWFGPKACHTTMLRCEPRPGGLTHFRMDQPDAPPMWGRFVYRDVVAPVRIVWVHSFADAEGELARAPFSETWPLELLATVTFAALASGTEVTLHWSPINATPTEIQTFIETMDSMKKGWGSSFEQLETLLAGGA